MIERGCYHKTVRVGESEWLLGRDDGEVTRRSGGVPDSHMRMG